MTITSNLSLSIALTTALATWQGVQHPIIEGGVMLNLANIPTSVAYPGKIVEKWTPVPANSKRGPRVHSAKPALVPQYVAA